MAKPIITSINDIPDYSSIVNQIPDYTDLNKYPSIESYYLEEYDSEFDKVSFKEVFDEIFKNQTWNESKLYYLLQAFRLFEENYLITEAIDINTFFDLFFIKTVKKSDIDSLIEDLAVLQEEYDSILASYEISPTEFKFKRLNELSTQILDLQIQIDTYTKYYERFYELFNNFVSYLDSYLKIIDSNPVIDNNLKKDLLIYYGKKIYEKRGRKDGFKYLVNILNPLTVTNNLTGEKVKVAIDILLEEWGEFEIDSYLQVPQEKEIFAYRLVINNLTNADLKLSIFDIIKSLVHPAGYKYIIQDYTVFQINLAINTNLFFYSNRIHTTHFYDTTDLFQINQIAKSSVADFALGTETYYGYSQQQNVFNERGFSSSMSFSTPELDYN